jgi:hypothetical protein
MPIHWDTEPALPPRPCGRPERTSATNYAYTSVRARGRADRLNRWTTTTIRCGPTAWRWARCAKPPRSWPLGGGRSESRRAAARPRGEAAEATARLLLVAPPRASGERGSSRSSRSLWCRARQAVRRDQGPGRQRLRTECQGRDAHRCNHPSADVRTTTMLAQKLMLESDEAPSGGPPNPRSSGRLTPCLRVLSAQAIRAGVPVPIRQAAGRSRAPGWPKEGA